MRRVLALLACISLILSPAGVVPAAEAQQIVNTPRVVQAAKPGLRYFVQNLGSPIALTDYWTTTASQTTWTTGSLGIGSESADRTVVICAGGRGASYRAITAVTIAGVSATYAIRSDSTSSTNMAEVWFAKVPSGTSGTISITWSGAMARGGIIAYAVRGYGTAGPTSVSNSTSAASTSLSVTTNAPSVALGCAYTGATNQRLTAASAVLPASGSYSAGVATVSGSSSWNGAVSGDIDALIVTGSANPTVSDLVTFYAG